MVWIFLYGKITPSLTQCLIIAAKSHCWYHKSAFIYIFYIIVKHLFLVSFIHIFKYIAHMSLFIFMDSKIVSFIPQMLNIPIAIVAKKKVDCENNELPSSITKSYHFTLSQSVPLVSVEQPILMVIGFILTYHWLKTLSNLFDHYVTLFMVIFVKLFTLFTILA